MRIFVTGATGLLGRAVVPELINYGHDVIGLARNDASRSMITAMHATAYSGQGYEIERLAEALSSMHAIVHLANALPNNDAPIEDDWAHSSKIVVGMLRHLLQASEATGVRTLIFPSLHSVYGDHGDEWVTEDADVIPDSFSNQYLEAETILAESTRDRRTSGVVLRLGMLYSAEAPHTRGLLYGLKQGQAPIGAAANAYWPQVHVADAAQAVRLALELSPAGEVFNICDNEPVQKATLYRDLAEWVGGPPPQEKGRTGNLSPYLGRIDAAPLHSSVRMSNMKARLDLGFAPYYETYRDGYPNVIREWAARHGG